MTKLRSDTVTTIDPEITDPEPKEKTMSFKRDPKYRALYVLTGFGNLFGIAGIICLTAIIAQRKPVASLDVLFLVVCLAAFVSCWPVAIVKAFRLQKLQELEKAEQEER